MGAVPMAVPHTRPIAITPHANRPELLAGTSPWRGELRIPSSAQSLLEVRLGEWGLDMLGFVAHIPHYLAQLDYPKAAAVLLEQVELAGRLTIDLSELQRAGPRARGARSTATSPPTRRSARSSTALEQQYDAFERAEESGTSLLADDEPLPTGEEIGQQFEQFLAGLDAQDGQRHQRLRTRPLTDPARRGGPAAPARPRDPRRRPLPRRPAALGPGPGLRRSGGRAGARGGDPQRGPGVRAALLPLLLPAARRLRGADHLRRRADPRRPLVPHPPGDWRASTAGRSTTRRSTSSAPRRASTTRT